MQRLGEAAAAHRLRSAVRKERTRIKTSPQRKPDPSIKSNFMLRCLLTERGKEDIIPSADFSLSTERMVLQEK